MSSSAAMVCAVRDDCGRPLLAVRSIELVVRNFYGKLSNVLSFQLCWEFSYESLGEELYSSRFDQIFIFISKHIPFHCIINFL